MEKQKKAQKNLEQDEVNERYRPYLIHSSTYSILTDHILMLMPSQRNVLLSMNEYELNKINPAHPKNPDSPTHVILFCIRFIADDIFQPIGGLLIYKHVDQSNVLAECIKAYINDLWKLNLHVVATVSPPFKIFKDVLGHLIKNIEIDKHSEVISYSVQPIKEIIHIYDIQFLLIQLQNLLQECDIRFKTVYQENKIFTACWKDISVIMNIAPEFKMLSDFLSSKENVQRRVHIFSEQIFIKYLEVKTKGLLSADAEGCVELLNVIRAFLKFFEYDFVYPPEYVTLNWSDLIYILTTMRFQKTEKYNLAESGCTQEGSSSSSSSKCNKKDKPNVINNTSQLVNKKNISPALTNEMLYKGFLTANAGFPPNHNFCDVNNCLGAANEEIANTKKHKTDAFDLKAALREMNCDINLVNYGNEEVLIEEKNETQSDSKSRGSENKPNKKENKMIYLKCKDKNKPNLQDVYTKDDSQNDVKNCDKKYVENKGEPPDDREMNFVPNNVTQELICTVKGIKQLMSLMATRRVRQVKPDALIVEHIDYLVTKIQSTMNRVDSVRYYGHPYTFMDTELAFSTLSNTKGLYLISKD